MILTNTQVLSIHKAIHSKKSHVQINDTLYPIQDSPKSKCRFTQIGELKFIEQNKFSYSSYATLAREEGKQITWAIHKTRRGSWGRIIDGVIEHPVGEA